MSASPTTVQYCSATNSQHISGACEGDDESTTRVVTQLFPHRLKAVVEPVRSSSAVEEATAHALARLRLHRPRTEIEPVCRSSGVEEATARALARLQLYRTRAMIKPLFCPTVVGEPTPRALAQLRQHCLRAAIRTGVPQIAGRGPSPALELNNASEKTIFDIFFKIHGLGRKLAHRVILERLNGPFLSDLDYDRRVKGLKFQRLRTLASKSGFSVKLLLADIDTDAAPHTASKGSCSANHKESKGKDVSPLDTPSLSRMQIASWNAGQMSLNSVHYYSKAQHLLRFVQDAGDLSIICVQEVYSGVADDLAVLLSASTRARWRSSTHWHRHSSSRMAFRKAILYRADTATFQTPDIPAKLLGKFRHPPQLAILRLPSGATLAIAHVHFSFRAPQPDLAQLPALLQALDAHATTTIAVGDFNANPNTSSFAALRTLGYVDVIHSSDGVPPHPYLTLRCATTAGGSWYDNVWMRRNDRAALRNAWVFDFGGRVATLGEKPYARVTRRRGERSDHLPIAVELCL